MKSTNVTIAQIRELLTAAFDAKSKDPKILSTAFPVSESGSKALENKAKATAGLGGLIYIARMTREFNKSIQARSHYDVNDPYMILFFSNSKTSGFDGVNELQDIARDALFKEFTLDSEGSRDVSDDMSGLFMAWTLIRTGPSESTYHGVTTTE